MSAPTADPFLLAYAHTRRFRLGAPKNATVTADGKTILFLRAGARDPRQSLFELDVASGVLREALTPAMLLGGPETMTPAEKARRERMRVTAKGLTSFELSPDGARIVVPLSGRLFVLERATGAVRELPTGPGAASDPHLSPDGTRVAYVRANDVHAIALTSGKEVRVTKGGEDALPHGVAEFIAQEELRRFRGFWWAPDGRTILYEESDSSRVETMTIVDPSRPMSAPDRFPYPRPGKENADVRFFLVSADGGTPLPVRWDRERFPYVATVTWTSGGPPTLVVLDRPQETEAVLAVDERTGATRSLLEEHDAAWVNQDPSVPRWLEGGAGFLWSTERAGAWQLELRGPTGELVRALTAPGAGYRALVDVDPSSRVAIIDQSPEPTEGGVMAVPLDGGPAKPLAASAGKVLQAVHGQSHDVVLVEEKSLVGMPVWSLRALDGRVLRELPSVVEPPGPLPRIELTRAGADETRVAILRPRGFVAGRHYAVIDAAYAGPHSTQVEADASLFLHDQWLADACDAIVVVLDARGTPRRDRAWERAIDGKLGPVPLEGHVQTLRALAERYPEMDIGRVGVTGWSFGGYFAALAALARPDLFRAAVAGAPVVDWRDYDTAYTERYLGLLDRASADYDASSLLTSASRRDRETAPILLVHGTADDNVYFFHSLKLAAALERGHHPFEFLPLPGVTHMLPADPELTEATWLRASAFLREKLGGSR